LPTGIDNTTPTLFFYAGVLAFAEGMLPIKIIAIANSHNRADLPLAITTFMGSATRWTFCLFASLILLNQEYILPDSTNFALLGALLFALSFSMNEILH